MTEQANGRVNLSTVTMIAWTAVVGAGLVVAWGAIAYFPRAEGVALAADVRQNQRDIAELKTIAQQISTFIRTVNEERARLKGIEEERRRVERRIPTPQRSPQWHE